MAKSKRARRRIFGVDPGTEVAGLCVLDYDCDTGKDLRLLDIEAIKVDGPRAFRLWWLHRKLSAAFDKWMAERTVVCVERAWVGKNPQTAIIVGEARGVVLAVAGGHREFATQVDYATYDVRRTLGVKTTKDGGTKYDVARIVRAILQLPDDIDLPLDATDAAAVALHHYLQGSKLKGLVAD